MQLICLNTWGARAGLSNLLAFLEYYQNTDVICLQEIWNGGEHMLEEQAAGRSMVGVEPQLLSKIAGVLPNHDYYFRPSFYDFWGLTIFVKKGIRVLKEGEEFIYRERGYISPEDIADHARNFQYITIETREGIRTIINVHAAWQAVGKGDTPERLVQSDNIVRFIQSLDHPVVLCGDFNLLPTTESIHKIEALGLRNLITENGIRSTRTSLYKKSERFADYTFVSPVIEVDEFRILRKEVSDHHAMSLHFR